jgi:tetratricopeptide (TPR) repeat protein
MTIRRTTLTIIASLLFAPLPALADSYNGPNGNSLVPGGDSGTALRFKRCLNTHLAAEERTPACRQLTRDNPGGVARAWVALGDIDVAQGDNDGAIAAFGSAVDHGHGWRWALERRAEVYAVTGQTDKALADADAIQAADGSTAQGLAYRCWIRALTGRDLDKALADCDAALAEEPGASDTLDSRGFVLYRMGRLPDAAAAYDTSLKVSPKLASSLYMRGIVKEKLGLPDGAGDIAAARAADPDIATTFARYGVPASN